MNADMALRCSRDGAVDFAEDFTIAANKTTVAAVQLYIHETLDNGPEIYQGEQHLQQEINDNLMLISCAFTVLQRNGGEMFPRGHIPADVYSAVALDYCDNQNLYYKTKIKQLHESAAAFLVDDGVDFTRASPKTKAIAYTLFLNDLNHDLAQLASEDCGPADIEEIKSAYLRNYQPLVSRIPQTNSFEKAIHESAAEIRAYLNIDNDPAPPTVARTHSGNVTYLSFDQNRV